MVIKAL
jgi:hypothetical protein